MIWRSKVIVLLAALCAIPNIGICITVEIDPGNSIVHTSDFNFLSTELLPEDVETFSIAGTFNVTIEKGSINIWGSKDPDTIHFSNINIITSNVSDRIWEFPTFKGKFEAPLINASEDSCFLDMTPGTCWYMGTFGSFSGNFDGTNLLITGRKDSDSSTGISAVYYEIS